MRLLPGESLDFQYVTSTPTSPPSDKTLDEKYVSGDTRIVTEQARYPLPSIKTMLESGDYNLNPDFQRRHRWDTEKQSRLIESFIMNVPVPPVFLYEDQYSHYEVMDGLQRMTAIHEFYSNKLALSGLTEWPELNGRRYSNLPDQVRRGVDRRYLSSIILLHETAKDQTEAQRLKQMVFERINSGGVKLEAQESRNAIYDGPLNQLCIKLARNTRLCRCWGIPAPNRTEVDTGVLNDKALNNPSFRKMKDVELVLRFFAYRQRLKHQHGSLEDYLDEYLKYGNRFKPKVLVGLEQLFLSTMDLVYSIFGKNAFLLYRPRNGRWIWYKRPTTAVYDPMMAAFSQHIDNADDLIKAKDKFITTIGPFYKKHYEDFEGRYTNRSNMIERNGLFNTYIEEVVG